MNFIEKLKKIFLYSLFIKDEDNKVINQIQAENRKFGILWTFIQIFYWTYCLIMAFRQDLFIRCRIIYIVMLAICGISFVGLLFAKGIGWLIFTFKILLCVALLTSGVFIAWILFQDDSMTIMLFVSVILAPILFINNTLTNFIMIVVNIVLASILLKFGLSDETYRWAISNLVIFSSIGVILGHFVNRSRFERYALSESAVKLAELQVKYAQYDQMTDLKNRRAFSEQVSLLSKQEKPCLIAIMIDINGLKKINDTYGHSSGDELIVGAANCIRESFKGIDSCYRLGGDEFCVIIPNEETDCVDNIKNLEELCNNWKGKLFSSISISYGVASTKEFDDIESALKEADHRMYEFKNNYYKITGKNRRRY